jgi:molybdate transport system substrate-binding protein
MRPLMRPLMHPSMHRGVYVGVAVAALALAACSSSSSGGGASASSGASVSATVSGSITVLAAASLTGTFTTLGQQFEKAHPGSKVTFSFGASSDLAQQIVNGSPADVFASASPKTMATVTDAGDAANPQTFASNVMEVATPPSNPAGVTTLADLAKSSVKVAVCAPAVPCGVAATALFAKNNLTVTPVTQEADVKSVLAKVELNAVDAGIVYVTDVQAAGAKVKGIPIDASANVTTTYPIATIKASKEMATAQAFVAYVLSADGQAVMTAAGFGAP